MMTRYALISGGIVATVVEQDSTPTIPGQWVEAGNAGPGWTYNGSTFAPPPPITYFSLTAKAFWRRFTAAEREALQGLVATGTQPQKNKLNAFRDYVATGGLVELNDGYIRAAVTLLETAGVIGAGRAVAILDAPVLDSERP